MRIRSAAAAAFLLIILLTGTLPGDTGDSIQKPAAPLDTTDASARFIDANTIGMWVLNNGCFARPPGGYDGLYYPYEGSIDYQRSLNYASGLWLAARVNDSLRVMLNQFAAEGSPGGIGPSGDPYGRTDPAFRVYKVGTADSLQHTRDWNEWPVDQGAPVNTAGDPLLRGDQTLWCCFTDAYPFGTRTSRFNRRTAPLGAEIHMTVWAHEFLNDVVFLEYDIINKSGNEWTGACVGLWADCEIGNAYSDRTGSDSTLLMVYDYESDKRDERYGFNAPALGYMLLRPPIINSPGDTAFSGPYAVDNYRPVQSYAPIFYKRGHHEGFEGWGADGINDPQFAYQMLQGRNQYNERMFNTATGQWTNWQFTGEPASGTGWLDPTEQDKRFLISAGPFTLAAGDTQTVTAAIVTGGGGGHLENVTTLKKNAALVRGAYFYDGVLHADDRTLDLAETGFDIPVFLTGVRKSLAGLTCTVSGIPAGLRLTGVQPGPGAAGFAADITALSDTSYQVVLDGGLSPAGSALLFTLHGDIDDPAGGTYTIHISSMNGTDSEGGAFTLTALPSNLRLLNRPAAFHLNGPEDGHEITDPLMTFSWEAPANPDGRPLTYKFRWIGAPYPYTTTADTYFVWNGAPTLRGDSTYRWTVVADDGLTQRASADTFSLYVPDLKSINGITMYGTLPYPYDPGTIYINDSQFFSYTTEHVRDSVDGSTTYRSRFFRYRRQSRRGWTQTDSLSFYRIWSLGRNCRPHGDHIYACADGSHPDSWLVTYPFTAGAGVQPPLFKLKLSKADQNAKWIVCESDTLLLLTQDYWGPNYTLYLFDLTAPGEPVLLREIPLNPLLSDFGYLRRLYVDLKGRRILIGGSHSNTVGIATFDESFQLTLRDTLQIHDTLFDCALEGNTLCVLRTVDETEWDGMQICELVMYDVSNPDQFQLRGSIPIKRTNTYTNIKLERGICWILSNPVMAVDVTMPGQPSIAGFMTEPLSGRAIDDGWIIGFTPDEQLGLYTLNSLVRQSEIEADLPSLYLAQNYPNPFNPETNIHFALNREQRVRVTVYDVLGRTVAELADETMDAGYHIIQWDGKTDGGPDCASGIYLCRIRTAGKARTIKMVKLH